MRYTWIAFVLACASDTGAKAINYSPGIEIIDPISPVQVLEGESVYFLGKVEDRNHSYEQLEIQWYLGEEVMCPWRTADEDGLSECIIDITWEDREVSATVRDPQSAGGFAHVELEVLLRDIPFAEIVEPLPGSFYYQNEVIPLTGVVQDGEDAAETLDATWNSDIEGVLNVESEPDSTGSFSTATFLSEGEHVLQLIVVDSDGKRSSDTVKFQVGPPNSNPTCSITAPSEGAASVFGALANFMGEVDDVDIGPSTLSVEWNSSRDGILSTTLPDTSGNVLFTHHGLSRGEHEITMTVRDERGAECSDSITHIVGTPPSIHVQSPGDGDLYLEGDIVNFGATVLDSEEAASGLQIEWSSDRDGVLHTDAPNSAGASTFSEVLSPGWHIVRLTATDSVGLYSEDTVSVLVNQRPATPTVEIVPNQPSTLTSLSAIVDNLVDLDGEVPTVSYSWYENGVQTLYSGATVPASELQKGETWRVEVIASDSYLSSDIAFDEVTVLNTAPQIHSISISPNSGIDNQSALVCSASASDVDEMVSVSYIWTNVSSGDVLGTSDQLQLDDTMVSPGEQVLCTAQTIDSDGAVDAASVSVFVENREPVLNGVHVHPTSVTTQDSLSCDIDAVDPDSHSLQYSYRWSVNGQVVSTDSEITLDPSWIQPLDTITCEGAAKDPYGGEVSGTASASVVDSPMSYDGLEIIPPEGVNNTGKLTCLLTATDPDEEAISKSYLWRNMTTGQMLGVSNPLQLDSSIAKAGDIIRCTGNAVDIH
ncbi:MAG: hypothetical protein VX278_13310, partial [Myxococcota bacterium]|nr:hypothetical protein [Myxococcota bacterium]